MEHFAYRPSHEIVEQQERMIRAHEMKELIEDQQNLDDLINYTKHAKVKDLREAQEMCRSLIYRQHIIDVKKMLN